MTFRNNIAAFGWCLSALFLAGCAAFTYILIRDGSSHIQIYPPDIPGYYPPWFMPAVLAIFWLAGIGLARHVANKPCIRVEVRLDKSVVITRRYPLKTETQIVRAAEMGPASVVQSEDGDGDPYFRASIALPDGTTLDIWEGSGRELCEVACARFNGAIGKLSEFRDRRAN